MPRHDPGAAPASTARRLTPVEIRQASQTGSMALIGLPRNLLGLQAWSATTLKPEATDTAIPCEKAEGELPTIRLPYHGLLATPSAPPPDPIQRWQAGALEYTLSKETIAILLRSPDLARPHALSPVAALQAQPPRLAPALEKQTFEILAKARLWDVQTQALSTQGKALFTPFFCPDARLLLLQTAPGSPSLAGFLGWREWYCYVEETDALRLSAPFLGRDLLSWLRRRFPLPTASRDTLHRLSLTEEEWIVLILAVESGLLQGSVSERNLFAAIRKSLDHVDRTWPLLGILGEGAFFRRYFRSDAALQTCLEGLLREKILALSSGVSGMLVTHPRFAGFFPRLFRSQEIVLLREDAGQGRPGQTESQIVETSLFVGVGEPSLVLSRAGWQEDKGRYLIHLEDPEWSAYLQCLKALAEPKSHVSQHLLSDTKAKIRFSGRGFR